MKRRTWIKAAGAAIADHFLIGTPASAADAIQPRTFQLLDPAFAASVGARPPSRIRVAGVRIQDVRVYGNRIYYLATPALSKICEIGCVAFDGTAVWRHRLPLGIYVALGVRDDGSPVVECLDGLNRRPVNSLYSVDVNATPLTLDWLGAVGAGDRVYFLNTTQFGRILNQNILELRTLGQIAAGQPPASYPLPSAAAGDFNLLQLGSGTVVVADFMTGDLIEVNPTNSSAVTHPMTEPGIAGTLTAMQGRAARRADGFYRLVAACGAGAAGGISLLISRFTKNGVGRLVQCDSTFNVSRVASVYLSAFPSVAPFTILGIGNETGIVFADGSVNAFAL